MEINNCEQYVIYRLQLAEEINDQLQDYVHGLIILLHSTEEFKTTSEKELLNKVYDILEEEESKEFQGELN